VLLPRSGKVLSLCDGGIDCTSVLYATVTISLPDPGFESTAQCLSTWKRVGREGGKMLTLLASREPLFRVSLMVCGLVSEVSAVSIDDDT
jgi:hypothetical protein